MIDRRFLGFSLTVKGLYDAPPSSVAAGEQFLASSSPSGDWNGHPNCIALYDGTKWLFTSPHKGALEVLNIKTGEILAYDGSQWCKSAQLGIAIVQSVVDFVYTQTDDERYFYNIKGARFIDTEGRFGRDAIYTSTGNGSEVTPISLSTGFSVAIASDGSIRTLNYADSSYSWSSLTFGRSTFVLAADTGCLYYYDGSGWAKVISDYLQLVNEPHSLTSTDISNMSLSLDARIAQGKESSVLCFVGSTVHISGVDFSASGYSISWNNLPLAEAGLRAGDIIIVQYSKG